MVKALRSRSVAPDRGANFVFAVPHFGQFAVRMVGQHSRDSPLRDDGSPFIGKHSVPTPSATQQALVQGGREAKVGISLRPVSPTTNGSQLSLLPPLSSHFTTVYQRS